MAAPDIRRSTAEDALGDHLVRLGTLDPAALESARKARGSGRLAASLARLGLADEDRIADAFAAITGLARIDRDALSSVVPVEGLNRRFLARHAMLPIAMKAGALTVAVADPGDSEAQAALRFAVRCPIRLRIACFSAIAEAIGPVELPRPRPPRRGSTPEERAAARMIARVPGAEIARLTRRLLTDALERGASDLMIARDAQDFVVTGRGGDEVRPVERLSAADGAAVIARLRVLSGTPADPNTPGTGIVTIRVNGRDIAVEASFEPSERVTLRFPGVDPRP